MSMPLPMPNLQAFRQLHTADPELWRRLRDELWHLACSTFHDADPVLAHYINAHVDLNRRLLLGTVTEIDLIAASDRILPRLARSSGATVRRMLAASALACHRSANPDDDRPLSVITTDTEILFAARHVVELYGRELVGEHPSVLLLEHLDIEPLALRSAAGFHMAESETVTLRTPTRDRVTIIGSAIGIPISMSLVAMPLSLFMADVRAALGIAHPDGVRMYYRTIAPPVGHGEPFVLVPLVWRVDFR